MQRAGIANCSIYHQSDLALLPAVIAIDHQIKSRNDSSAATRESFDSAPKCGDGLLRHRSIPTDARSSQLKCVSPHRSVSPHRVLWWAGACYSHQSKKRATGVISLSFGFHRSSASRMARYLASIVQTRTTFFLWEEWEFFSLKPGRQRNVNLGTIKRSSESQLRRLEMIINFWIIHEHGSRALIDQLTCSLGFSQA